MKHSSSAVSFLVGLTHRPGPKPPRATIPLAAGPRVIQLTDPLADIETAARALGMEGDDVVMTTQPNGYLSRRRSNQQMGVRASGLVTFEGRVCCVSALRSLDQRLHLIKMPYIYDCAECGSTFRVEMGVIRNGR